MHWIHAQTTNFWNLTNCYFPRNKTYLVGHKQCSQSFRIMRGTLGYIRNRRTEEKSSKPKNRLKMRPKPKTEYIPHWIIKPKNRSYFLRKPDAKKRKIRKLQRTPKPKNQSLLAQKPKQRSKKWPYAQNRKSQCPPR